MSNITYGIQIWGTSCKPSVMNKVQTIQTNTMKWLSGNYNSIVKELLIYTKWLSVYQMSVYYSLLLYWKVKFFKKPARLVCRILKTEDSMAKMLLTEGIWTRTTERHYRLVESKCIGVTKISSVKRIFSDWVKFNIPIRENYDLLRM